MDNMYFNKNAGKPKRPSGRSDGYIDDFEDISSFSENSVEDEYEDISSGRDIYFDDISSGSHGRNGRPPVKKKKKHRILKSILIIILIIILAIAGAGYSLLGKMKGNPTEKHQNQFISENQLHSDKNVTNILLLGVDAREGETASRSDTMMLISIDKNNKK